VSVSAKRRARALRESLVAVVPFDHAETDRIAAKNPDLAAAVAFMGCPSADEDGPYRDDVVTWSIRGHSGPGLYIECSEYPEEGTCFVPMLLGDALREAQS
jgi:hypothetical protein